MPVGQWVGGRDVGDVSGDPRFAAVYRESWSPTVRVLTLMVGSQAVAEELAQEAFVRLAQRWDRIGRYDEPGAWTLRVAMNLASSSLRRRAAERRAAGRMEPVRAVEEPAVRGVSTQVREALAALPERQRAAVVLRYLLDLSPAQTATAMGIAEGTVRQHTHRGMARLREVLGVSLEAAGEGDRG